MRVTFKPYSYFAMRSSRFLGIVLTSFLCHPQRAPAVRAASDSMFPAESTLKLKLKPQAQALSPSSKLKLKL
jgi:hypothetical protein